MAEDLLPLNDSFRERIMSHAAGQLDQQRQRCSHQHDESPRKEADAHHGTKRVRIAAEHVEDCAAQGAPDQSHLTQPILANTHLNPNSMNPGAWTQAILLNACSTLGDICRA